MGETQPTPRSYVAAFFDRLIGWVSGFPPEICSYTTQEAVIPADGDEGIRLAATLYLPVTHDKSQSVGTILVRTPYGRGGPMMIAIATIWAARGYTVLVVSSRGTYGSTGTFDPGRYEMHDGLASVKWMRQQDWYTGRFATLGMSYLGFTQWALMHSDDPLDDYVAAVISVGPHDFAELVWGNGALWLTCIDWAHHMALSTRNSPFVMFYKVLTQSSEGVIDVKRKMPLVDAVKSYFEGNWEKETEWLYPWLRASRTDVVDDPEGFWKKMRHGSVLETTKIPILLIGGFQDLFIAQTMEQYRRLSTRKDAPVALTVGPFSHASAPNVKEAQMDSWAWMEKYLSGRAGATERPAPVRIKMTGVDEWRWLEQWPPATKPLALFLSGSEKGSLLLAEEPGKSIDTAQFTFDPHDPTPTCGGPLLFKGGYVDDSALAQREDVLAFDGPILDRDIEVMGRPQLELVHSSDNPHTDLFIRLCCVTVDVKTGVDTASRNLCETYRRLDPKRVTAGEKIKVELEMTDCAHRFVKGTRIRVIVAGGCFPQWAFNLGSDERQGTGMTLIPAKHSVHLGGEDGSRLLLPVAIG